MRPLILLSPAKSLNFERPLSTSKALQAVTTTQPTFLAEAHALAGTLSSLSKAELKMHRDGSGTFTFTKIKAMYAPTERVIFDRVRDVKGCVSVLGQLLPAEVAAEAGFSEGAARDD